MRTPSRLAGAVAIVTAALLLQTGAPRAQQPGSEPDVAAAEAQAGAQAEAQAGAAAALLDEAALDRLVAPVALFPDTLLAQVLVAATFPLELVKAQRWVGANADLAAGARADAAEAQGWDPSVAVLAAGFPSLVDRMADDLDATEALGAAVIAQTEDVMDAIQRQRGRAAAFGNLESNAAQTVTEQAGAFTIAPADPEVVYLPAYNPETVYTQPAAAAPVVVSDPADTGYSSGALVATGAIAFGAGLLVNELFDDDDDDWGGYWRGPPRFDWDDGDFHPRPGRPGINAGGDVTINVDRDDRGPAFSEIRNRGDAARRDGARADGLRDRAQAGGDGRAEARARLAARSDGAGERERARDGARDGAAAAGRAERAAPKPVRKAADRPRADRPAAGLQRAAADRDGARKADRPRAKAGGGSRGAAMKPGDGGRKARAAEARGKRSGGGGGERARKRG